MAIERADVAIVGAGPAGMMAAIAAVGAGGRVLLCEQLDRPGAKLLVTGGGRCNLTNTAGTRDFMARFGRCGRFMQPAMAALDAAGLRRFLAALGVPTHCPDGFHVYPRSDSAKTVQQALWRRCGQLGVRTLLGVGATALVMRGGALVGLETTGGPVGAARVILAGGGKSRPALGATGACYDLARHAGHAIVPPTPALVPLVTRETWPRRCAGVSATGRVWIDLPRFPRRGVSGEILFTHRGLSGPAVLDISGDVARVLTDRAEAPIRIAFDLRGTGETSPTDPRALAALFNQWRQDRPAKHVATLLGMLLPRALAEAICQAAEVASTARIAALPAPAVRRLIGALDGLPLTVVATEGFDGSMVTRGGVSLTRVDPRTLQSRLLTGLFFAGELLDLDGPCGGYNLQWAFSSGHLAGRSAAGCITVSGK